jgi:two-component system, NtrC family, response regulator AlgB
MTDAPQTSWAALVADDDAGVRQSLRLCLEAAGAHVLGVTTGNAALEAIERGRFDVLFLDLWLGAENSLALIPALLRRRPELPIVVVTAFATFETAVEAMRLGASDYLPKPFSPEQVRLAARRVVEAGMLKRQVAELQDQLNATEADDLFETASPRFRAFLQTASRAAASDAVILLRGESGTGKNVLARWIRAHSPRSNAAFVSVNCPGLSSELMSSTLFGHRRGAFTGAVADALGKVQEAEGGTLFLDEVGDLSADAQARLLRFLNDRSYERLGETTERRADVRLVAATNRDLESAVRAGAFREDLLFRLNVVTLTVPPLRERREDLLPLARHYLRFFARRQGRRLAFPAETERAIEEYDWPGNLRELRNSVERAAILSEGDAITARDLNIDAPANASGSKTPVALGAAVSLDEIEREHIARVLASAPSVEWAARTLGIGENTLLRKRRRYNLA